MKISFLPKSRLGKTASILFIYSFVIFISGYVFAELLDLISSDILLSITGAAAVAGSLAALITGIITIIRNKDHSILVFLAILLGLIVLIFIFGNMFFPENSDYPTLFTMFVFI